MSFIWCACGGLQSVKETLLVPFSWYQPLVNEHQEHVIMVIEAEFGLEVRQQHCSEIICVQFPDDTEGTRLFYTRVIMRQERCSVSTLAPWSEHPENLTRRSSTVMSEHMMCAVGVLTQ